MNLFKRYFIPHEENEYKPHLFRKRAALLLVLVILGIEFLFLLQTAVIIPRVKLFAIIFAPVLVDETNLTRVSDSLPPLKTSELLEAAAMYKAKDMAERGYFAHVSPDGRTPWYWFKQAGYDFSYAGENLAVNFSDSKDVVDAWMKSPRHRANILNSNFTEIGIATAQGIYQSHEAVFVVQLFGAPLAQYALRESQPSTPVSLPALAPAPAQAPKPVAVQKPPAVQPKPVVIAESSISGAEEENLYLAVKSVETGEVRSGVTPKVSVAVEGESISRPQSNSIENIIVSPRKTVNYILYFLGTLLFAALLLNILIKIRVQHRALIVNGLLLFLVIAAVFMLNQHLSLSQIKIL